MSEPKSPTCTRLSEVMGISHDSVNRFLLREAYEPQDLFAEASKLLNLLGGTLNVDDGTLDRPYSQHMELVPHFWPGKHHRVVKGPNLVMLCHTDPQGRSLPVNCRVHDKAGGKTKNGHFLAMLAEVLAWGPQPDFMTGDSWCSGAPNLKAVKNHHMGFMFAVESDRRASTEKGTWAQVQTLDIPADGQMAWSHGFGGVKLFRTRLKDQLRHCVAYLPNSDAHGTFRQTDFQALHGQHWQIGQYHRMIKQACHIGGFQVRGKVPIRNPIFAALCSHAHLQQMQLVDIISKLANGSAICAREVAAAFVSHFMQGRQHLNPQFQPAVNA